MPLHVTCYPLNLPLSDGRDISGTLHIAINMVRARGSKFIWMVTLPITYLDAFAVSRIYP